MNIEAYKAIGVLDSGVGGLTVVQELYHHLPYESVIYFGDTARFPYGPRPHEEVKRFALDIIDFLKTQEVKLVVVACNSAAAAGLPFYKQYLDIPVIGVIEPGVRAALKATRKGKIGVIGTAGTINSRAYDEVIRRLNPSVQVYSRACPLLVLIVENNLTGTSEAFRVTEEYLYPLKEAKIDALILGCTHYPLMSGLIEKVVGREIKVISSAEETAREVKEVLSSASLLNPLNSRIPRHRFFVSGKPGPFEEIAEKLLGRNIKAYQVSFS